MRVWIGVTALLLVLYVPALSQSVQTAGDAHIRLVTAATAAPVEVWDAHVPLPVTVWFKDGRRVGAHFIRSNPDSFLFEIGGARLNVPPDEVEGVLFQARRFDSFSGVSLNDIKARLDYFAIELQQNPMARGFVFCYAGRRYRPGEAGATCDRIRDYLIGSRGISEYRFVTVDAGFRETLEVELWFVPPDADPPAASPTVDPSEARLLPAKRNPGKGKRSVKSKKPPPKKRRGR